MSKSQKIQINLIFDNRANFLFIPKLIKNSCQLSIGT